MIERRSRLILFLSICLLAAVVILDLQYMKLARDKQDLQRDLSEINNIRYGLLNVDEWSDKVENILNKKISEFEITPENEEKLQKSVENILYSLIDEVEKIIEKRTSGTFSGIKRWIAGFAVDVEQLRDSVPSFSHQVLTEMERPENKSALQDFLSHKLEQYADSTRNKIDYSIMSMILVKYNCSEEEECKDILNSSVEKITGEIELRVLLILILAGFIYILNLIFKEKPGNLQTVILVLASLSLLMAGIITPMIELEARIDTLQMKLLGEDLIFRDNILYFRSKSITDMVIILISDGSFRMILVGLLIFLFSIIFPSLKLLSTLIYRMNLLNLRNNKIVEFFVLKSGKWSMADVMVVAIFMAYIGFDGIISNQLADMNDYSDSISIFTTNGTQLLGGFYLFLAFVISSLILSQALTAKSEN